MYTLVGRYVGRLWPRHLAQVNVRGAKVKVVSVSTESGRLDFLTVSPQHARLCAFSPQVRNQNP